LVKRRSLLYHDLPNSYLSGTGRMNASSYIRRHTGAASIIP
jgi:hypothetical protein